MPDFCILRLRKRTLKAAAAMARHALREDDTPNADATRSHCNVVLGGRGHNAQQVLAQMKAATDPLAKRKDAVRCIEFLIAASPSINQWDESKQDRYYKSALAWIGDRFGGGRNVHLAVLHRDETTPHLQVLLAPILHSPDGTKKLAANKLIGGPAGLKKLQDDFAAQIGQQFGLERGVRGSRRHHEPIRSRYTKLMAANDLDQRISVKKIELQELEAKEEYLAVREEVARDVRARQAFARAKEKIELLNGKKTSTARGPRRDEDRTP